MKIIVIVLSGLWLRRCLVGATGGKSPPGARPWHRPLLDPPCYSVDDAALWPTTPQAPPTAPQGRRPSRSHAASNFEIYVKNKARPSSGREAVGRVAFSLGRAKSSEISINFYISTLFLKQEGERRLRNAVLTTDHTVGRGEEGGRG